MSDCVIWKRRRRIVGELGVKQMGRAKDTRAPILTKWSLLSKGTGQVANSRKDGVRGITKTTAE